MYTMFMNTPKRHFLLPFLLLIGHVDLFQVHAFTPLKNAASSPSSANELRAVAFEPLAKEGSWSAYVDHEETGLIYYFNTMTGERSWTPPSKTFPLVDAETLRQSYYQKQYKSDKFDFNGLRDKIANACMNLGKTLFGNAIQYDSLSQEENDYLQVSDSLFSPSIQKTKEEGVGVGEEVTTLAIKSSNIQDDIENTKEISIMNDNILLAHYGRATDELKRIGERIENTKTFLAGFAGGIVTVPFVAFQDIVMKFQLSEAMLDKVYFDTSINSIECALFALMLRSCVREGQEDNKMLNEGIVIAFTLIRTMSKMSGHGSLDWGLIPHATIGGFESFVMFTAAAAVYDFGCKHGLISRLK